MSPAVGRFARLGRGAGLGLLAFATASADELSGRGNVNGLVEQPLIEQIVECHELERLAIDALGDFIASSGDGRVDDSTNARVDVLLDGASECVLDAISRIGAAAAPGVQPGTQLAAAQNDLRDALRLDGEAARRTDRSASERRERLYAAFDKKAAAAMHLQGMQLPPRAVPEHDAVRVENRGPPDAYAAVFGKGVTPNLYRWIFDARSARVFVLPVHDDEDDKKALPVGEGSGAKRAASRDYHLAFRAKPRTATGAYGFLSMNRELRGPFQLRFTAGSFTRKPKALAALGTAFGCVEFDVKGTDPLEFVSFCVRPTAEGTQVFVSTRDGNLGQAFLAESRRAVVDVVYDGTTFTCRARRPTDPVDEWVQVATWTRAQGSDVWVAGVGASQLSGFAEIGVDDILIWAIER